MVSEAERLAALADFQNLSAELDLDAVCRTAASLFDAPIAFSTLVGEEHVTVQGRYGTNDTCVVRDQAFCDRTIELDPREALVIHDLTQHPRFCRSTLVTGEPGARFYAGVPIATDSGANIGTLCVLDRVPRHDFGEKQIEQLIDLGRLAASQFRLYQTQAKRRAELSEHDRVLALFGQQEAAFRVATAAQRLAEEAASFGQWRLDMDLTMHWSFGMASVFGHSRPQNGALPLEEHLSFYHPDDRDVARARVCNALLGQGEHDKGYSAKSRIVRPDGEIREVLIQGVVDRSGAGASIYGVILDITEISRSERHAHQASDLLRTTLESMDQGLIMLDDDLRVRIHNARAQRLFELPHTVLYEGAPFRGIYDFLVERGDLILAEDSFNVALKAGTGQNHPATYEIARRDGVTIEVRARPLADGGNVRTYTDVSHRRQIERRIQESEQRYRVMAIYDALTNLPNRTFFWDRLRQELGNAERYGYSFAVLACDLDRFKAVNDTLGHPAGDELLRMAAERFRSVLRPGDTVARLGGDEFAIILASTSAFEEVRSVAERLISLFEAPVDIDGHKVSVGLSIGIAMAPQAGAEADTLFRNADIALYRAKSAGRNTYRLFEGGMDKAVADRNMLEVDMRDAVMRGGFMNYYQPIICIADGAIVGFEALLRWEHPVRGLIGPADFIPLAEETGLITALGDRALRDACCEAMTWPAHMRVAVNVSVTQIKQAEHLTNSVLMALASSGLPADRLELEITESVLVDDAEAAIQCLGGLRDLGVRIALDDFGTGYSSLSYLRRFPFSKIKIDRAFVASIGDSGTAAIVRAVVGLARRAEAEVTAEGVETKEQLAQVTAEGCTQAQGYLFSRPIDAKSVADLLRRRRAA